MLEFSLVSMMTFLIFTLYYMSVAVLNPVILIFGVTAWMFILVVVIMILKDDDDFCF